MRSVVLDDNISKDGTPEIQHPGPTGWGFAIESENQLSSNPQLLIQFYQIPFA